MLQLVRTDKEFTKENLPLDFLRRATAMGSLHNRPLEFKEEDFEVEEKWKGVSLNGSTYPWKDEHEKEGFVKSRNGVWIRNNTEFDTFVTVSEGGRLQGYFKSTKKPNIYPPNPVEWCNLLIEYGFLTTI